MLIALRLRRTKHRKHRERLKGMLIASDSPLLSASIIFSGDKFLPTVEFYINNFRSLQTNLHS